MQTLGHYIGGKEIPGRSGRNGEVFDPNTGEVQAPRVARTAEEVAEAVGGGGCGPAGVGRRNPQRRARVLRRFLDLVEKDMDSLAALLSSEHGKTDRGCQGRHPARPRGRRVRRRRPAPAQGRVHRQRRDRHRRLLDAPAARRGRGHHPVQLPGHDPAVEGAARPSPAATPSSSSPPSGTPPCRCASPSCSLEAGLPDGVLQRRQRRQGGGGRHAGRRPRQGRRLRRLHRRSPQYIYDDRRGERQAGPVLRRRQEPHGRACPTPTWTRPWTPSSAPATARRGSAAWRSRSPCRWARRPPTRWSAKLAERVEGLEVGHSPSRRRLRPARQRRTRSTGSSATSQIGVDEGAELVVDGRGYEGRGLRERLLLGPTLFDNVTPDMKIYQEEIFGPVLSVVRAADFEEALRLPREHEYGNGVADLHPRRRRRPRLHRPGAGRHGRRQRARSRCRSRTTPSAAGSGPASATSTSTVPTPSASTRRPRRSRPAGRRASATAPASSSPPCHERDMTRSTEPEQEDCIATRRATSPPRSSRRTPSSGTGRSTSRSTCCARPASSASAASTSPRSVGGSGAVSRLDAVVIFEAAGDGLPVARGLHLDPQHGRRG